MGVLEFLVPFYPINTALVVFSSDLKMDPLNLYHTIVFFSFIYLIHNWGTAAHCEQVHMVANSYMLASNSFFFFRLAIINLAI